MAILRRGLGFVVASYTGDAASAAVDLDLGFVPCKAEAIDVTSGSTEWYWNMGMSGFTSGGSNAVFGVFATNSAGGAQFNTLTYGGTGIIALVGSGTTGIGLTIGTNTIVNAPSHGYIVTAWEAH